MYDFINASPFSDVLDIASETRLHDLTSGHTEPHDLVSNPEDDEVLTISPMRTSLPMKRPQKRLARGFTEEEDNALIDVITRLGNTMNWFSVRTEYNKLFPNRKRSRASLLSRRNRICTTP
jgi:hypothetical protein